MVCKTVWNDDGPIGLCYSPIRRAFRRFPLEYVECHGRHGLEVFLDIPDNGLPEVATAEEIGLEDA